MSQLFFVAANGRLSFANPNYHLDPARLEEGLNSTSEEERRMYQEWFLKELEEACSLTNKSNSRKKTESRLSYASLDVNDMGVNLDAGPVINVDVNTNNRDKLEDTTKTRYMKCYLWKTWHTRVKLLFCEISIS